MSRVEKLREFFAEPVNTVTRERIFFHRLAFDLKIAAARVGYHLYIHEPDVDRDGFDIVLEDDDDTVAWHQTKAALASAGTASWNVGVGFLRPSVASAHFYGFDPVEAGRGGGVIVIEIGDDTAAGEVVYRYTDFDMLAAIASGFLQELPYGGRGRPAGPAKAEAEGIVAALKRENRKAEVALPKKVFVTVRGPDELLGITGMRTETGYGIFSIRQAYGLVEVDPAGRWKAEGAATDKAAALAYHMKLLSDAQPKTLTRKSTLFKPFAFP